MGTGGEEKPRSKAIVVILIVLLLVGLAFGGYIVIQRVMGDSPQAEGTKAPTVQVVATQENRWVENTRSHPWAIPRHSVLTDSPAWQAPMLADPTDLLIANGDKIIVAINAASVQATSAQTGETLWELSNPGFIRCDQFGDLWCSGDNTFGIISLADGSLTPLPADLGNDDEYIGAGAFLATGADGLMQLKIFSADDATLERTCTLGVASAEVVISRFNRFAVMIGRDGDSAQTTISLLDTSDCSLSEPFAVKSEFADNGWQFIEGSDGWLAKPLAARSKEPKIAQVLSIGFDGSIRDLDNALLLVGVRYRAAADDQPVRTREELLADFQRAELHPDTEYVRVIADIDFSVLAYDDFTQIEGVENTVFNGSQARVWGMTDDRSQLFAWDRNERVLRAISTADSRVLEEIASIGLYHLGNYTVIITPEKIIAVAD